ncbi:hypothetical protein WN55_07754 [Dufourea novaeangliae]|uniref:Uncharacterized protein n=1 Tax=Dufourea novaeangliae TaxID=178035 RepID=A0A154PSP1_DUFNO|nr:hypothetical protein WN55_07754 [Dufourea novaeangliae]
MKGTYYEEENLIKQAVTEQLNRVTQEEFSKAFKALYKRCTECVARGGMYVEN